MAYLELCLVVSDLLFIGRRKTFLSGRGRLFVGRLSADLIYSTLCSDSEAEIRDAGGLTSICSVPATLTVKRQLYKKTLYQIGRDSIKAFAAYRELTGKPSDCARSDREYAQLARGIASLVQNGDLTPLEDLAEQTEGTLFPTAKRPLPAFLSAPLPGRLSPANGSALKYGTPPSKAPSDKRRFDEHAHQELSDEDLDEKLASAECFKPGAVAPKNLLFSFRSSGPDNTGRESEDKPLSRDTPAPGDETHSTTSSSKGAISANESFFNNTRSSKKREKAPIESTPSNPAASGQGKAKSGTEGAETGSPQKNSAPTGRRGCGMSDSNGRPSPQAGHRRTTTAPRAIGDLARPNWPAPPPDTQPWGEEEEESSWRFPSLDKEDSQHSNRSVGDVLSFFNGTLTWDFGSPQEAGAGIDSEPACSETVNTSPVAHLAEKGHCQTQARRGIEDLGQDQIERLRQGTPQCPYLAAPTPLSETILSWRPVFQEVKPFMAILQYILFSTWRDDDYDYLKPFVGMPIPSELLFDFFGISPSTAYNNGINSGMLLELYRTIVDEHLTWSDYDRKAGRARVITSHGIPEKITSMALDALHVPEPSGSWTYLITGQSANRQHVPPGNRLAKIAQQRPVVKPPSSTRLIQGYLNDLPKNTFAHGRYGTLNDEALGVAIDTIHSAGWEKHRRHQELKKLFAIRRYRQPLYPACDWSPRLKSDSYNLAMNLATPVRRALYTDRDRELDLSKAHFASYVVVAEREGLLAPTIRQYLEAGLEGDEELLTGGDLWTDIAEWIPNRNFPDRDAARTAAKSVYAAVCGSSREGLLREVWETYRNATSLPFDGTKDDLLGLLHHPIILETFETRDRLRRIINDRNGLADADGRPVPLEAWDEIKAPKNQWRGLLSYVNASFEQKLMAACFRIAKRERERPQRSRFHIWLYQGDGFTMRVTSKASITKQVRRLQKAVAEEANRLGMPTRLTVDYPAPEKNEQSPEN